MSLREPPPAAVQLDLDGATALAAHYGGRPPRDADRLYESLAAFLEVFEAHRIRATLFVVGSDTEDGWKRGLLARAASMGHELANHTYNHPGAFLRLDRGAQEAEVRAAQEALAARVGVAATGFRAPNFELDEGLLGIIDRLGFSHDSSLLGTPFGPALRLLKALLAGPARGGFARGGYLGRAAFGLAPRRPYRPAVGAVWREGRSAAARAVLEVPVTVSPLLRLPCHASFALALPAGAARALTARTLDWAARRGVPLVYVFHLADLGEPGALGGVERRLYGPLERRRAFVEWVCALVARRFVSVTTAELARRARAGAGGR